MAVLTIPNILTIGRIVAVPVIVLVYYWGGDLKHWIAVGIFSAAAITDFFDGYLARRFNDVTMLGRLLDPIADKLLVAIVLMLLVWDGTIAGYSALAAIVILAREILVSGLREFLASAQVSVPVTQLAKWKTTVQLVAIGFLLAGPSGDAFLPGESVASTIGLIGLWAAAALTFVTGYDYLSKGLQFVAQEDAKARDARNS